MFYLILAIMLALFYIFVAPKYVKGTINLIVAVFILVLLSIALILGFLKMMQLSIEILLGIAMVLIGLWAMRDIHNLDSSPKGK
ncbi:TPA: DUF3165 family protein [Streptococcus suis]|nr:DUF3165 family protein [Streptococcus suis]HEM6309119.1 DUF3165 family protein [Streptococcus suis]HEM6320028.1 DUF3165 family protein [Streptococcus suis]HEP1819622.1 DUF3165 family protein [Streptococcus suis]